MTAETKTKEINWAKTFSAVVGAAAPPLLVWLAQADHWLIEHNGAVFVPIISALTAYVSAKGTEKGSLSLKRGSTKEKYDG